MNNPNNCEKKIIRLKNLKLFLKINLAVSCLLVCSIYILVFRINFP